MNIDVDRALRSLSSYSGLPETDIDWEPHLPGFFHQFEIGRISEFDFRENLRQVIGQNIEDDILDYCWNQLLLDIPAHRLNELLKLRQQYTMVLLSNTNSIHTRVIHSRLQKVAGTSDFRKYFDRVYYSYEMNLAKPDPRIFQVVLDQNNFQPDSTLLVDDNGDNIQAASELGLQVFQVKQPDDWIDFLNPTRP